MGTRNRANGGDPRKHTAIIGDVKTMWQKLVWDIHQLDQIQRSNPDLREPLGFAALNVCIAAASLADWTVSSFVSRRREEGQPTKNTDVHAHILAHVHQQAMCEAIANTAKHARLQDGLWPDGEVRIDWNDASEDDPPGFILRHVTPSAFRVLRSTRLVSSNETGGASFKMFACHSLAMLEDSNGVSAISNLSSAAANRSAKRVACR